MFLFLRKEAADVDGAEMFYREAGELCDLDRKDFHTAQKAPFITA